MSRFAAFLLAACYLFAATSLLADGLQPIPNAKMSAALQPFVDNHILGGAVMMVATKDRLLCLDAVGFSDLENEKPMQVDNLFWLASISKTFVGVSVMMLVDEGKLNLDDPVEKYLPEFKGQMLADAKDKTQLRAPRHPITVRECMNHTSGLPTPDMMPQGYRGNIPASNVIICASHTHRGPLWPYYKGQLVTPIADAVALAAHDLTPCTVGTAKGRAEGVSECRRVIKDGHAWNRWQLKPDEADKYPAEDPSDPAFDVLALIGKDGKFKAVVYNFACHAANEREPVISADFPGDVEKHVQQQLGYNVPTLFLTGACGDVNPIYRVRRNLFGEKLGGEIVRCLGQLEPIAKPSLSIECREFQMPGREHPEFKEAEVARNWPGQLEHYRQAYETMKKREKPSYQYFITGIRIGDDFAIVTSANELFCSIGMSIKEQSPFKHTMTAEQTNGAHGYVPTAKAFENGSYETWFGEHSYLSTKAGEIIERESLDVLNRLKRAN